MPVASRGKKSWASVDGVLQGVGVPVISRAYSFRSFGAYYTGRTARTGAIAWCSAADQRPRPRHCAPTLIRNESSKIHLLLIALSARQRGHSHRPGTFSSRMGVHIHPSFNPTRTLPHSSPRSALWLILRVACVPACTVGSVRCAHYGRSQMTRSIFRPLLTVSIVINSPSSFIIPDCPALASMSLAIDWHRATDGRQSATSMSPCAIALFQCSKLRGRVSVVARSLFGRAVWSASCRNPTAIVATD